VWEIVRIISYSLIYQLSIYYLFKLRLFITSTIQFFSYTQNEQYKDSSNA